MRFRKRGVVWGLALFAAVALLAPRARADAESDAAKAAKKAHEALAKVEEKSADCEAHADRAMAMLAKLDVKKARKAAKEAREAAEEAAKEAEKVAKEVQRAIEKSARAGTRNARKWQEEANEAFIAAQLFLEVSLAAALDAEIAAALAERAVEGNEGNPSNLATLRDDLVAMAVGNQGAADQIALAIAHETATGQGIVVAVLDGGFNTSHPYLMDRLAPYAFDAIDFDGDPNDGGNGYDDYLQDHPDSAVGHGTFVAGMILMAAPDATILPIRVIDDEGYGTVEELRAGLAFAIDMGVDVINLSLVAGDREHPEIAELLEQAYQQGIVIVSSTGNDGDEQLGSLAGAAQTIAVGAVDTSDTVAPFSNWTMAKDETLVFAPGVALYGPHGYPMDSQMAVWSGTSFSAGIVSGGVALYLQQHPAADTATVHSAVASSVAPVFDSRGRIFPDAGRIDLARLVTR